MLSEKDMNEVAGGVMQFYAISFGWVRKICVMEVPVWTLFRSDFLSDFVYENWGRLDSNQRIPKERDLQSVEIQSITKLHNTYQPKKQYVTEE